MPIPAASMPSVATVRARRTLRTALTVSLVALGGVLWLQYGQDAAPCLPCVTERLPWLAACALACACLLPSDRLRAAAPWVLGILAFLFAWGLWLSVRHLGLERGWWTDLSCASTADQGVDLEGLWDRFLASTVAPCDRPGVTVLGVSVAGWDAALSLAMLVEALAGLRRWPRDVRDDARSAIAAST